MITAFAAANALQTALFLAVTFHWKISAHSASMAGLAVLAWILIGYTAIWFVLSVPIVAWGRVRLQRHTISQTFAGSILGATVLAYVFSFLG